MTASALVTVFCDGCGEWDELGVADTAVKARKALRGTGWRLNVPSQYLVRLDYCPNCA